jgi:pimeloyl-ACP methyl ester carboxylesterase
MNPDQFQARRKLVSTPSGDVSFVEMGEGPVALFVHGVLVNGYLWRHQMSALAGERRCIAIDLLAHGGTAIDAQQDVSSTANATMLLQFLDAMSIDQVDLVGNDSGGGIAMIFAANHPQRVRSLALTDCDTHDNWPPAAFKPFLALSAGGGLPDAIDAMLADKNVFRSQQALGPAYEHPEQVEDATIEAYLRPHRASPQRTSDLARFLAAFDCRHTVAVEAGLKRLAAPTLIAWGTDDAYFGVEWSHWLARTIPGTRKRLDIEGGRLFLPEERWQELNAALVEHWRAAVGIATAAAA